MLPGLNSFLASGICLSAFGAAPWARPVSRALLAGYIYLVARKVIKWYVPAIFVGTVFLCFLAATGDFTVALYEILAGGLFLGAIFMATDYVTTPITDSGRMLFALGCGIITFVILPFLRLSRGRVFLYPGHEPCNALPGEVDGEKAAGR